MSVRTSTPARAHASPDDEAQVLDTIERWVEREVRPIARRYDQADDYPTELVAQMRELGLFGATIGQQWGGLNWHRFENAGGIIGAVQCPGGHFGQPPERTSYRLG